MLTHNHPGRHRAASSSRHAAPASPLHLSPGLHRGHHRPPTPVLRPSVIAVTAAIAMIVGLTGTAVGSAEASNQVALPTVHPTASLPTLAAAPTTASAATRPTPSPTSSAATDYALAIAAHGHPASPSPLAADGIPTTALVAYKQAVTLAPASCGITWALVAAIGRVESDHGRFGGATLHTDGTSTPKIIGIALDGTTSALIRDTDHGRLDGDTVYDRAVGPMQFIPSTWAIYGVDGNGDRVADPFNIFDAAATTARYLCAAAGEVRSAQGMTRAISAYNHSDAYVAAVLTLDATYAGTSPVIATTNPDAPAPTVPPANPGPPAALATEPPAPSSAPDPSATATQAPTASPTSSAAAADPTAESTP